MSKALVAAVSKIRCVCNGNVLHSEDSGFNPGSVSTVVLA